MSLDYPVAPAEEAPASFGRFRNSPCWRKAAPALLIGLFFLAVTWKLFLTRDYSMLISHDDSCQSYAWLQYIAKTIRAGDFPFWDPTARGGQSFVGEVITGAFYPPNWLTALVPPGPDGRISDLAIEGLAFLHAVAAALFMRALARFLGLVPWAATVAGLVFACSGSVLFRAPGQLDIFFCTVWTPLVILFFLKALRAANLRQNLFHANLAGLFLALSFLAGHIQPTLYTGMGVVALGIFAAVARPRDREPQFFTASSRRAVLAATLGTLLFAALYAAPQLVAALEYSDTALRTTEMGQLPAAARIPYPVTGEACPLGPASFLSALLPQFLSPENVLYFGVVPLALLVVGLFEWRTRRDVRVCAGFALLFLVMAMGKWSPVHALCYLLVPGFDKGRETARVLLMFHFFAALLCGVGAGFLLSTGVKAAKSRLRALTRVLWAVAAAIVLITFAGHLYGLGPLAQAPACDLYVFMALLLAAGALLFRLRALGAVGATTFKALILFLILNEVYVLFSYSVHPRSEFNPKYNMEPVQWFAPEGPWRFLLNQPGPFRVDIRDTPRYSVNSGKVNGLETVNGFGATVATRFARWSEADPALRQKYCDLLNVKYILSPDELPLPLVYADGKTRVYRNPTAMDRVWLVGEVLVQRAPADGIVRFDPALDLRQVAVLDDGAARPASWRRLGEKRWAVAQPPLLKALKYRRTGPNTVQVAVNATGPGLLVLSENDYPGWTATVNGAARPLQRVDGILKGVFLEAGRSLVIFEYLPTHFALSLTLEGLAALALLGLGIGRPSRKRLAENGW